MPGELKHMPGGSALSDWPPMPRLSALGSAGAACLAQHGIAVDRFAREIVGF